MLKSELLNQFGSFGHELSSLHAAASSAGGHSASGALSSSLDRSSQLEQLLGSKLLEISQLHSRISELEGNLQEQQQQQQSQANEIKRLQVHIVWLEEQSKLSEQLQVNSTTRLQADNDKLKKSNQQLARQASEMRLPLQQLLQELQDAVSLAARVAMLDAATAGSTEQLLGGRSLLLQQPAAELHSLLTEQVEKLKRVLSAAAAAGTDTAAAAAAAAAADRPASAAPELRSQSWSFDRELQQLSPSVKAR
jgi:DNA repair exonuclease SbcCD ATPase subunit